jgi:hypothetical protein
MSPESTYFQPIILQTVPLGLLSGSNSANPSHCLITEPASSAPISNGPNNSSSTEPPQPLFLAYPVTSESTTLSSNGSQDLNIFDSDSLLSSPGHTLYHLPEESSSLLSDNGVTITSRHPIVTRTQDNTRTPRLFPDYIAHHSYKEVESRTFNQASTAEQW